PARLDLGQLGGAPEMALRRRAVAQALGELRELEVRGARFLEGQARFEVAARLAPQAGLRAEAPERREQLGIAAAAGEPALGALDAHARLLGKRFAVQPRGQLAI